ncbi:MAG: hypothetical protein AABY01_01995 [Nanoarchaeota archaeon]
MASTPEYTVATVDFVEIVSPTASFEMKSNLTVAVSPTSFGGI